VILPQTDADSAKVLAEKLRRLVEGHTFLQEEGINARLGVSLGLGTVSERGQLEGGADPARDKRMYEDKENPEGGAMIESAGTLLYRRNGDGSRC
jgi:GGDEF domain-containing protein